MPLSQEVPGRVVQGYGVASGRAKDCPYPGGSIANQVRHFRERGLDISRYFSGTLGVSIEPFRFRMVNPSLTFRELTWFEGRAPEHFSFAPCRLIFRDCSHEGLIYYPHPETKREHFHKDSTFELLLPFIKRISDDCEVRIVIDSTQVEIREEA